MSTLLTIGTFELAHFGHARLFRRCENYADEVIVGVNSDDFVWAYKKIKPLYSESVRSERIRMLGYPTVINHSAGRDLIEQLRPDVVAVGTDWVDRDYLRQIDADRAMFEELDCALLYLPYTPGISSTELKTRIRG